MAGTTPPLLPIGRVFGRRTTQGYWRIHDRTWLPSLRDTNLVFIDGEYLELTPIERPILTLIPTAMFGPPEKVWSDKKETLTPGLVVIDDGKGRAAYVPWDIGGLYYRHSSEAHANLLADLVDHLLPKGRQIRTNAHPARGDDADGSAGAQPDTGPPRERHRPPRHGVLRAHRDARHPHRATARDPARPCRVARSRSAGVLDRRRCRQ